MSALDDSFLPADFDTENTEHVPGGTPGLGSSALLDSFMILEPEDAGAAAGAASLYFHYGDLRGGRRPGHFVDRGFVSRREGSPG